MIRITAHILGFSIAFFWLFGFSTGQARASESCDLARHLMQVETLSVQITVTGNTPAAQKVMIQMLAKIRSVPPGSGRIIEAELDTYDLAAFLESRAQMARIFANHGLAAAQSHINKPSYRNLAQGVRRLSGLLDCGIDAQAAQTLDTTSGQGADADRTDVSRTTSSLINRANSLAGIDAGLPLLGGIGLGIAFSVFAFRRRVRQRDASRYMCDISTELRMGSGTIPGPDR